MSSAVSRREWAWVTGACLLILAATGLPVWAGYTALAPGQEFGGAVYDRADTSVHLAAMRLGLEGATQYRLLFTTEAHPAAFVKLGYVVLGQAAGAAGLSLPAAYEAARLIAGLALLLLLYRFVAHATASVALRRMGFLMAAAGSGLGWLQWLTGWAPNPQISPMDLWLIDAYVFFGLMTFPHFAAVAALVLGMALAAHRFARTGGLQPWLVAALCGQAVLLIQPFGIAIADAAVAGVVVAGWNSVRRQRSLMIGFSGLLLTQLPLLGYNAWVFRSDPVWAGFASQNVTLSPPVGYLIPGFGIFVPLALAGSWISWRRRHSWGMLSAVWIAATLPMAYLPTGLQRRFLGYWTIPLAVLAVVGVERGLLRWARPCLGRELRRWRRRRGTLLLAIAAATLPTSLYLSAGGALYARLVPPELFDPVPLLDAIEWLDGNAAEQEAVFAAPRTALLIPYQTGLPVFVGHPMETVDYPEKVQLVEAFYQLDGMREGDRQRLLAACGCRWVVEGPFEAVLGGYPGEQRSWLVPAYEGQGVRIWRVRSGIGEK